jgi:YqaJ-like viral recombinase domain
VSAPQGTHDWLMERVGFCTASRFKDVLAVLKSGKPAAARQNYLTEIICERLTGQPVEHFVNAAMKWGTEQEPHARAAYCKKSGNGVTAVGFMRHKTIKAGASPDGVIDMDGGLEIKCPTSATHLDTLMNGMSEDHLPQVQGGMWITGLAWWDFVSYDPRMPEPLQLHIQRIERDDAYIAALEASVVGFLGEVDETVSNLLARGGK